MAEHPIDIDRKAWSAAGVGVCADRIGNTVSGTLRLAAAEHDAGVNRALDILAHADLADRNEAWHGGCGA